jgi:hypothetical protein
MHEQDQKFKKAWEKTQLKGRWHYGLTHGSIFGAVVFILLNLIKLKENNFIEVYFTVSALEQLLTMILAGILGYATIKWWMNQNIYRKIIDKERNQS